MGSSASEPSKEADRKSSVILGGALVVLCAFIWYETASYPEDLLDARKITGPGTFPRLLSLILGGVGVWESVRALRTGSWRVRVDWGRLFLDARSQNIAIVIAMTALVIPLTRYLGFSIGSGAYMLCLMARLKAKPWQALVCSCLAVIFVVLIFNYLFRVQLPIGILTEPLGWRY
jgi:hypothetical protein